MFLKTASVEERILIGKSLEMNLERDRTGELWRSFMPLLKSISHTKSDKLYSLQVYPMVFDMNTFTPQTEFTKWTAVEVSTDEAIPDEFSKLLLPAGEYAVFLHKGSSDSFHISMRYIFEDWLPKSNFQVDDRPHFELLGKHYKVQDPSAEEEIWIPITEKAQL